MAGGLSEADIERMRKEAEKNKETDQQKQLLIQLQEKARKIISTTEDGIKGFDEQTHKILDSKITHVQKQLADLRQMLNSPRSKEELEKQTNNLEDESRKLFTESYNMKATRSKTP